ncbi:hypothetical protein [Caulobacter sp. RHG1]|uniref:hypothetical protein n=1 Tax=Caulobacter sp. (strain RHG1) TaxID=2545762 RepID=UPI0015538773|nr:hypothetical protein [Caulobacter sp. RHG1]NQE63778.1 hypothetical protein [Caulobacter sp. RHG1]
MRRALLALLVIACAGPSLAAQPTPPKPQPKPAASALAPMQSPLDAPNFVLPTPIPLAAGRPYGDAAQCRAICSRTLYFCNAASDDDGCSSRWAQCNSSCAASYVAPRFGGR